MQFLKIGVTFPFVQSLEISSGYYDFRYYGERICNYVWQFPQDPGMNLITTHGLVYVQVPQMVSNFNFSYDGRDLILLSSCIEDRKSVV